MFKSILYLSTLLSISYPGLPSGDPPVAASSEAALSQSTSTTTLSSKSISLNNRYDNESVNNVFKDNILLTFSYLSGEIKNKSEIVWEKVEKPKFFEFSLKPGEIFAFHDQILPSFREKVVKTTNAHFNYQDGFKSDGYLTGDGVCHFASLIYWASKDAGLVSYAPTNHDFAKINEVPKEYGVSIYALPGALDKSARENLYITNNLDKPVTFIFLYDGSNLTVKVTKSG